MKCEAYPSFWPNTVYIWGFHKQRMLTQNVELNNTCLHQLRQLLVFFATFLPSKLMISQLFSNTNFEIQHRQYFMIFLI